MGIFLKHRRAYKESKLSLESKLGNTGKRIASLESDKESFIANNIEESRKLVKEIPIISERLERLDYQYQMLINEQQDIENKFEKVANQFKESLQSKLLAFTEEENSQLKAYQDSLSSLADERLEQLQTEELKHEKTLEKLQKRAKEVGLEKARHETSLQNISPPTELKSALQASEKMLSSLNLETSSLDKSVTQATLAEQDHSERIRVLGICCGQLKLATSLEVNPNFSSAIIGDSPPLLACGR
ncbi:ATP-binding protein [Leucothrix arctica]|uniref:ATP-binding protein n=1 Tax=Leucothrix arctica TaxID=1481894 RepID=UPI001304837B|nr:ATP-binding protein [Leucothrix arctica]